jgi:hypothetical protein
LNRPGTCGACQRAVPPTDASRSSGGAVCAARPLSTTLRPGNSAHARSTRTGSPAPPHRSVADAGAFAALVEHPPLIEWAASQDSTRTGCTTTPRSCAPSSAPEPRPCASTCWTRATPGSPLPTPPRTTPRTMPRRERPPPVHRPNRADGVIEPLRGHVYRVEVGYGPKPRLIVSYNRRNRNLHTVIAARITTDLTMLLGALQPRHHAPGVRGTPHRPALTSAATQTPGGCTLSTYTPASTIETPMRRTATPSMSPGRC